MSADVNPLVESVSGNARDISVEATALSGDVSGTVTPSSPVVTAGVLASEANFITASAKANRVFGATVTVIGQPLTLANSIKGTYSGTITLTVN